MFTTLVFPLCVLEMMRRGAEIAMLDDKRDGPWHVESRQKRSLAMLRCILDADESPAARTFVARLLGRLPTTP